MRFLIFGQYLFFLLATALLPAQTIAIDTLLKDKISIRAIAIDKDKVWYAADKGRVGFVDLKSRSKKEYQFQKDAIDIEFRSLAQTQNEVFVLNVGNPALLYEVSKQTGPRKLVYQEKHEKVFYDSMQFWNEQEGIAIGDPTENCFSILLTKDGGHTWQKQSCNHLPKLVEGEAAFAASNTNIILKGDKAWIVSGGVKSRVFFSSDKGKTWTVTETPIVQGKSMTGIFTADFYDEKNGIVAGGDYEVQSQNFSNKAITKDGGQTWTLIADNQGFGYASCIQYVPNSKGKELLCVGGTGIWYSGDSAETWKKMSDAKDCYTLRFEDEYTAIAAGRNGIIRIKIQK